MSASKKHRNNKKPRQKPIPPPRKRPSEGIQGDSYIHLTPVWKFGLIDLEGEWGWGKITRRQFEDVLDKINNFDKQKWNEIRQETHGKSNKTKHHHVPTIELCRKAQRRLVARQLDELQELFSLRLSGEKRIWGKLENENFHFIWYDPEHTVCPSLKR